jgi:CheY-like chemotaxis protein
MRFKPDFIILDLAMPKFDGFAACPRSSLGREVLLTAWCPPLSALVLASQRRLAAGVSG